MVIRLVWCSDIPAATTLGDLQENNMNVERLDTQGKPIKISTRPAVNFCM